MVRVFVSFHHNGDSYFRLFISAEISQPCSSKPCKNGARCINDNASYKCVCLPGFTSSDCEEGNAKKNTIYPYSYLKDRHTNTWKDNFSNVTTIMLFEHKGSKSKGIRIDSPIGTDISLPSSYFFSLQAKFKRRIFHVLKSIQMSYKVGFTHFALSSVHETVGLRFYTNVTGDLEDVSKLYVFIHFCGQKLIRVSVHHLFLFLCCRSQ